MIHFEEALKIVTDQGFDIDSERVDFNQVLNRVLAEDIKSDMPMPPFDKSAVDGYACKKEDLFETTSCYDDNHRKCGRCLTCYKRKVAFFIPKGKSEKKNLLDMLIDSQFWIFTP